MNPGAAGTSACATLLPKFRRKEYLKISYHGEEELVLAFEEISFSGLDARPCLHRHDPVPHL
jgi:hypothetical protein